jgi:tRNA (cmo5U34)-methyltransferase
MGTEAHLGIDLSEYDARIRTFIPDYELMHDAVAAALRDAVRRRRPTIVELGIGTGALGARSLEACPSARLVGIDEDSTMLAAAQARLGGRLRALPGSFESIAVPPADAIVACLALHHVPPGARRQRLFRRLRQALRPGGVLVNADCFPASNPRLAAADRAAWIDHLARSYSRPQIRGFFRRWADEDHYVPLDDELIALRRAGFRADVALRRRAFAVIVASRPS